MATLEITLRERLRSETRTAHDMADAVFRRFDLTDPDLLRPFLAAHRDAFGLLVEHAADAEIEAMIRPALDALDADLDALGGRPAPADLPRPPKADDGLAQRYIWLGSRLGTRMLARRWAEGTDPTVRAAGRYLSAAPASAPWRALCDELEDMSARGTRADLVVQAAKAWFAVFETAGHLQLRAAPAPG